VVVCFPVWLLTRILIRLPAVLSQQKTARPETHQQNIPVKGWGSWGVSKLATLMGWSARKNLTDKPATCTRSTSYFEKLTVSNINDSKNVVPKIQVNFLTEITVLGTKSEITHRQFLPCTYYTVRSSCPL
jgi:hypothetical protein